MRSLQGKTVVVTGASRGIGRGLAIGLGECGATVYITGRRAKGSADTLEETAAFVRVAGGICETFAVDHSDDDSVESFFETLSARLSQKGATLDLFVNNAYAAVDFLIQSYEIPFWKKSGVHYAKQTTTDKPGSVWDIINNVGLRNNFVCCTYALRIMEKQQSGLVVNISSWGGLSSIIDPVYAVGKSGVDRLSAEVAQCAPEGVSCITLCPGAVATESMKDAVAGLASSRNAEGSPATDDVFDKLKWNAETPLFVGRVLAAIAADKSMRRRKSMNGRVVISAEAACVYRVNDEHGKRPLSLRSFKFLLLDKMRFLLHSPLRWFIPDWFFPWFIVRSTIGAVQYW